MSYSNPLHHAPDSVRPLTPATAGLLRQRQTLARQNDELRAALRWALEQIEDDLDLDHRAALRAAWRLVE